MSISRTTQAHRMQVYVTFTELETIAVNWSNDLQSHTTTSSTRLQQNTSLLTSNHKTVMVFVTMWPWHFSFWPPSKCMLSDCHTVYM